MNTSELDEQRQIRRAWETPALEIVKAIKRDFMPDMDSNDGGEILSWILDLVVKVHKVRII